MQNLEKIVSQCTATILYIPTKNEIAFNDPSFPIKISNNNVVIPKDRSSDPFECAINCAIKFNNIKVCVLIPGTKFDMHGTRQGKGGGWYDRFLSKIPPDWLRIGVSDKSQMSNTQLFRKPWDEPVDWVIVKDGLSWEAYKTQSHL